MSGDDEEILIPALFTPSETIHVLSTLKVMIDSGDGDAVLDAAYTELRTSLREQLEEHPGLLDSVNAEVEMARRLRKGGTDV